MSKAVKKIFKPVKKVVSKVGSFIKNNWKTIVLAAAAVFTAGAALGYVGMSATGGLAFGAGAGAGGFAGVGTAFSALGNSALGMVGIKGSAGTGIFGQSTVAAMQGAGVANSGALAASQGAMSGLVPASGKAAAQASAQVSQAALAPVAPGAPAPGSGLMGPGGVTAPATPVPGSPVPVTGAPASPVPVTGAPASPVPVTGAPTVPGAGPPASPPAASGSWLSRQGMGDWAQMGGLALATYGALSDKDEKTPDYAMAGDHSYRVDPNGEEPLMKPKYRSTSISNQAARRYAYKYST